jgi:hypothetical protein
MTANDSVEWLHRRGLGEYEGWRARGLPEVGAAVLAQSGRVIGAADGDSLLSRRGARAPQAGGGQGGFWPRLDASPEPLRESRYKLSVGNRWINSARTPFTLDPCGPQALCRHPNYISKTPILSRDPVIEKRVL